MKLILVRHGQATAYCADDAGRDLTEFGQTQAQQTAEFIHAHHTPDVVIASPYNRANQTAKIILSKLNQAKADSDQVGLMTISSITPDDDPVIGLDDIECAVRGKFGTQTDDITVVVVCHMPIVARMSALLDGLSPTAYELAECRVYDTPVISANLATQVAQFIPVQP